MFTTHTIETARLRLEPLHLNDYAFIIELLNSPGWLAFIGERHIHTKEEAEAYINKIIGNQHTTYWVARTKQENISIGVITLIQRDYLDHPDIGFAFLPAYSKKGYAFEAADSVLQYLIKNDLHAEVIAITVKENYNSIGLLEKLGLRFREETVYNEETLLVYAITADKYLIDQLTTIFFRLFSNANGQQPQLDHIHSLCIPETVIIRKTGLTHEIYNLETFITPRKKMLSDGTLTEFEEKEITEVTSVTGTIAQRSSTYRKRGVENHKAFEQTGHKFFQYIKTIQGWKINAVIWEDEAH